MKSILTSVLKAVGLSLFGVSLTACTGETHKKESNSEAVPVTVGRVQRVQEREAISVSGTVSTPNSPAQVCFSFPARWYSWGHGRGNM